MTKTHQAFNLLFTYNAFKYLATLIGDGIEILHHNQGHNRLIVLYPRLEEWVIESARKANVSLRNYNLPTTGNELHEVINFKIKRFEELLDDLKQSSERVKILKRHLTEPF